jgi:predicted nucleic acid-binding protein
VRLADPSSLRYVSARAAVDKLLSSGELLGVSAQILIEFWAVATRPINVHGLGWTIEQTNNHLTQLLAQFELVPEGDAFLVWRSLVIAAAVSGKHAHDARLATVMQQHGITCLLSFNIQDFSSFKSLTVLNPVQMATSV